MDLLDQLTSALGTSYTIERELGGGGMSRVFVAEDTSLGRKVVVKVLPPELAAGVSIERFKREIALAARLQHPHIVPLFSAGDVDGLPYFTMPLIEGESLRARIAKRGELPLNEAVRVLREVASALDYAHEKGVVHRDIKPDNVLLSRGSAMVTDFGVAKALSASSNAENSGMTSLGVALGTPAYMSPEQASADPNTDHRADIYAFGVLAYEILTGQPPFVGRSPQGLLAAHVTEAPEHVTRRRNTIPAPLAALVMRCLEKRAADRPQSAQDVVHALDALNTPSGGSEPASAVVSGAASASTAAGVPPVLSRKRRPLSLVLAVVAGVALLGATGWVGWRASHASTATTVPSALQRVVVATFQNKSGDPALAPVGDMAADWIARGLAGTGIVDVAGTAAELRSRAGVTLGTGAAAIEQLGKESRASLVISGAYYKQGDSILFQADFTDVRLGKLIQSVGPVAAPISRPLDGVELLRQRVTGALAPIIDSTLAGAAEAIARPPSYEAYREFLRGEALSYTDPNAAAAVFARAAALDSNYIYPHLRFIAALYTATRWREVDSAIAVLERRRAALSSYEAAYLDYLKAGVVDFDLARAGLFNHTGAELDAAARMHLAAPRSAFAALTNAGALGRAGYPRRALAELEKLDPMSGALRGRISYFSSRADALHATAQYERQLENAHQARVQYPGLMLPSALQIDALAALGREQELRALLDSVGGQAPDPRYDPFMIGLEAMYEARAHGHAGLATSLARWLDERVARTAVSPTSRLNLDVAMQRWDRVSALADSILTQRPKDASALEAAGIAAAKFGARAKALSYDKRILDLTRSDWEGLPRMPGGFGDATGMRRRANIAAALGEFERAAVLLRQAWAGGWDWTLYHQTPTYELLRASPGFQALITPRG